MNNKSTLKPISSKITLAITVNGQKHSVTIPPTMRLIELLREKLFLTGTKEGCGKGECGACTVLVNGKAILSCLILAVQVDNKEITTIEGLSQNKKINLIEGLSQNENIAPIQEAFIQEGASQCGFCIPGMIVSSHALLDENSNPSLEEVKYGLGGNLCRCTGYLKIFNAVKSASKTKNEDI